MVRMLNCRLTQDEYDKVDAADRLMDDDKGLPPLIRATVSAAVRRSQELANG